VDNTQLRAFPRNPKNIIELDDDKVELETTEATKKKANISKPTPSLSQKKTNNKPIPKSTRQPSVENVDDDEARSSPTKSDDSDVDMDDESGSEDKDASEEVELPAESAEAELSQLFPEQICIICLPEVERLQRGWNAPIYSFFKADPDIEYFNGRRAHVFSCIAQTCKAKGKSPRQVNRFVDKGDASSTSNLRKHAKICWGDDNVKAADDTKDVKLARGIIAKSGLANASITAMFERAKGKGAVTYSHTQHTKTETK
jgi:hypothetical protein